VLVCGRVQGVFFRDSTAERARRAGVDGWVRNLRDGRVEAVFEGEPDAVRSVIGFCSQGPQWARVDGIEVSEEPPEGLEGFQIR
jgi:acylphosphatase